MEDTNLNNISMKIEEKKNGKKVVIDEGKNQEFEIPNKEQNKKLEQGLDKNDFEEKVEKKVDNTINDSKPTFLTLETLLNIKTIVEAAIQRNAFKKEEMNDVLGNYQVYVNGLQTLVNSQQKANEKSQKADKNI
mgnify:FL=1